MCWLMYLTFDAKEDYQLATVFTGFDHRSNARVRGAAGFGMVMCAMAGIKAGAWVWVCLASAFGTWLIALGWIYFDSYYNHLKKKPVFAIGTGGVDNWFVFSFGDSASMVMTVAKLLLFVVFSALLYINLIFL